MNKRKTDEADAAPQPTKKAKVETKQQEPVPYSEKDYTNYIQWTLATLSQTPGCWFGLIDDDQKTKLVKLVDGAKFKKDKCYEPKNIPPEYLEMLGAALVKLHGNWLTRKAREPVFTNYYFVIADCGGSFVPGITLAATTNLPERYCDAIAAAGFLKGEQPLNRAPIGNVTTFATPTQTLLTLRS
jgi:hypothetical protein